MKRRPALWSRRSALQTLAVGAGGLSYLGSWNRQVRELAVGSDVRAAVAGPPKRLLIVFNINGIPGNLGWNSWIKPGAGETDYEFGPITTPLEKHRADLLFVHKMIFGTTVDWGETHWTGVQAALTSAKWRTDTSQPDDIAPSGPSIDMYLGDKLGKIATPQWPSLQINLQQRGYGCPVSFDATGKEMPAYDSPWVMYDKMFGSIADGGKVTPDPNALRRVMMRKSILDGVAKNVAAFRARLPQEDRARADAQLDAIRTLEQRLGDGTTGTPGASCQKPTLPAQFNANDTKKYHVVVRATTDLVVSALACDLTRVVMYGLKISGEYPPSDFPPVNSVHQEHQMSHDFQDEFVTLKKFYMTELSYLLDRLKAIPEVGPDGKMGTMLDNTIVLWATEVDTGHAHGNMPWMAAGGRNMGVNTGRLLKLPTIHDNGLRMRSDKGYPHGALLLSIINAMGLPDKTFGDPAITKGPMQGFLKT